MTDDLVQWLRAVLDGEAEEARLNADAFGSVWTSDDAMECVTSDTGADVVSEPYAPRSFIAAHDPARVLRDIDAKRQALDHYEECARSGKGGVAAYRMAAGAVAMQIAIMALPYADRPGYREEWRP